MRRGFLSYIRDKEQILSVPPFTHSNNKANLKCLKMINAVEDVSRRTIERAGRGRGRSVTGSDGGTCVTLPAPLSSRRRDVRALHSTLDGTARFYKQLVLWCRTAGSARATGRVAPITNDFALKTSVFLKPAACGRSSFRNHTSVFDSLQTGSLDLSRANLQPSSPDRFSER